MRIFTCAIAIMLGAGLLANMALANTSSMTEMTSDSSTSPAEATTVPDVPTDSDDSSDVVENPTQPLPDTIDESIPDEATLVSPQIAVDNGGEVKDVRTGETVTDPEIVGTPETPADPLAKTNGESFIPVPIADVKEEEAANDTDAGQGASNQPSSALAEPTVSNSLSIGNEPTVTAAALGKNQYGAHWGSHNGTPAFFESSGKLFVQQAKGVVDVSSWQGTINWNTAKKAGVEGAIIRIGYGWGHGLDKYAKRNINECKRLGIPFGVYLYSYAYDNGTAAAEGNNVVNLLRKAGVSPNNLSFPVYYDLEQWTWTGHAPPTNPNKYNGIVNTWYSKLQSAGYHNLSVYSYTNYLNTSLNHSSIRSKTRWVARYGPRNDFPYSSNDRAWQYTSSGRVKGISGKVDLNVFGYYYKTAPSKAQLVYRVYNPNSGLHHYTTNYGEVRWLSSKGWRDEGLSFYATKGGGWPVYRVYNPHDGNHLFTKNANEKKWLVRKGWRDEGVAWTVPVKGPTKVYRLYNPHSGEHVFTVNGNEYASVHKAGWHQEGEAWRSL